MICKRCGAKVLENQRFCTKCGYDLSNHSQQEKKPKGQVKKGYVVIALAIIIFVIVIAIAFSPKNRARSEMRDILETGNMDNACTLYETAWRDIDIIEVYKKEIEEYTNDTIEMLEEYDLEAVDYEEYHGYKSFCIEEYGDLIYNDNGMTLYIFLEYIGSEKAPELESVIDNHRNYFYGMSAMKSEKDYIDALEYFSKIPESNMRKEKANENIALCVDLLVTEKVDEIKSAVVNQEYEYAAELVEESKEELNSIFEEYGITNVNTDKLDETVNAEFAAEAARYAEKAATEFANRNAAAAVSNIEISLMLLPGNKEYKAKLDEYKKYLPFELYKEKNVFKEVDEGDFYGGVTYYERSYLSNANVEEPNCISWYSNYTYKKGYSKSFYLLKGNYDKISGKVFVTMEDKNTNGFGYFEVYGDGKLLYTSPKMSGGVEPVDFEFNCSGVYELEMRYHATMGTEVGYYSHSFAISNLAAQKNYPV